MNHSEHHSVGIIGLGWLGLPLAQHLTALGVDVIGTNTQADKVNTMESLGVKAELLKLPLDGNGFKSQVFTQDVLIVAIPPKIKQGRVDYPELIQSVVSAANEHSVKHLILISTTAIYNGLLANVDESTPLSLNGEKVALLNQAEQAVTLFKNRHTILRLGGLIGPKRHPGRFMSISRPVRNANHPINLVHQRDVITAICAVIKQNVGSQIFNVVAPSHCTKRWFYQLACEKLAKDLPNFIDGEPEGKCVLGNKITQLLPFSYQFDDMVQWLELNND